MRLAPCLVTLPLAAACATRPPVSPPACSSVDVREIRAAEQALVAALQAPGGTWVTHYTEDAVLVESGEALVGRAALQQLASAMGPLSSVAIHADRTEGRGDLAYVTGTASWVGRSGATTRVRLVMIWRKEADGRWRLAHEIFAPEATGQ